MSRGRTLAWRVGLTALVLAGLCGAYYVSAPYRLWAPWASSYAVDSAEASPTGWDREPIAWNDADPPVVTAKRTWLLPREAELQDRYVLILTDAATGRGDMVITDRDALLAAQGKAFVEHAHMGVGSSIFASVVTLGQGLSQVSTLAHFGHGGWVSRSLTCWFCAHDGKTALPRYFAGLLDAGRPVTQVTLRYDTRAAYDAAFKTLRAQDGLWIEMTGSYWSEATETTPAGGRIKTWQLAAE
ncbi:hypothetical protein [uncultured Litoreibacter sp.]|uniref:hypothetical protein n=1 Tax=uncultured Litoreibacter sp. TaxID=1392394 RepID=UPI0026135204|nr:hypothetical protein [uncultured Litoreibacter sp.]